MFLGHPLTQSNLLVFFLWFFFLFFYYFPFTSFFNIVFYFPLCFLFPIMSPFLFHLISCLSFRWWASFFESPRILKRVLFFILEFVFLLLIYLNQIYALQFSPSCLHLCLIGLQFSLYGWLLWYNSLWMYRNFC